MIEILEITRGAIFKFNKNNIVYKFWIEYLENKSFSFHKLRKHLQVLSLYIRLNN